MSFDATQGLAEELVGDTYLLAGGQDNRTSISDSLGTVEPVAELMDSQQSSRRGESAFETSAEIGYETCRAVDVRVEFVNVDVLLGGVPLQVYFNQIIRSSSQSRTPRSHSQFCTRTTTKTNRSAGV